MSPCLATVEQSFGRCIPLSDAAIKIQKKNWFQVHSLSAHCDASILLSLQSIQSYYGNIMQKPRTCKYCNEFHVAGVDKTSY